MSELGRLRWNCRRGMKELDELLLRYLDRHYAGAPAEERRQFAALLELPDPDLLAVLSGRTAADPALQTLVRKIAACSH